MKKVILILSAVLILSSCDQITDFISFFVDIEPSRIEGTENTQFMFKANTNDTIDEWIIDGAIIPANLARTAKNKLHYSFSSGTHKIGVLTINGAVDEVEVSVDPVETVFSISSVTGNNTTEIYLDYPLLTIDGGEYNVETMAGNEIISVNSTETHTIYSIRMEFDFTDSFVFINNNAYEIYGIDLQAVTISQLNELIVLWFPERLEPESPGYYETIFNLSGYPGTVSDYLTVFDDRLQRNREIVYFANNAIYIDNIRKVSVSMTRDNKDSFLFINNNMYDFFGINLMDMSYSELVITADILNRYPAETVWDLVEVYNP